MALSNWATLALDQDGKATNGTFVTPLGIELQIYKNWLYVRDERAWRENSGYVNPTVMHIEAGHFEYLDLVVRAQRGPQQSVIVMAWDVRDYAFKTFMVGIGCYGFEGSTWVGVEPRTLEALKRFVANCTDKKTELVERVFAHDATFFNQGDAYFEQHAGVEKPTTVVGEKAPSPLIMQMLKGKP